MASIVVALTTFAVILLAELPDKTAMASLVLGTRYRAFPALCGIAAGFAVHVILAVVAGSLLALLPHRILAIVVAALFLASAVVLLIGRKPPAAEPAEPGSGTGRFWPGAAAAFAVILVAEFGDLTQAVIANLVARYQDPIAVGVGAFAAMWSVAAAAVIGGKNLLRRVPATLVSRGAAAFMVALACFTLAGAFR